MCGIAGVLSLIKKSIKVDYTKPMLDKIAQRGPDDAGYLYFSTGSKDTKKSFYKILQMKNIKNKLPIYESKLIQKDLHNQEYDLYMGLKIINS